MKFKPSLKPALSCATASVAIAALAFIGVSAPADAAPGAVTGVVFRDFDADGVMDTAVTKAAATDVGVEGVGVAGFDSSGQQVASAVTLSDGSYTLNYASGPATAELRVEFQTPSGWNSAAHGQGGSVLNGTSVQFVTDGGIANYGILKPTDFSDSAKIIVPIHRFGGSDPAEGALYSSAYSENSEVAAPVEATQAQIGTVWGAASVNSRWVLTAAFAKRHAQTGPGGPGAIYLTDTNSAPNGDPWLTVAGAGADPRGGAGEAADYPWPSDPAMPLSAVYKTGLGDMDITDDNSKLFVVNLTTRHLVQVDVELDASGAPSPAGQRAISMPLGLPGTGRDCADNNVRPFGLEVSGDSVYATLTCTGPTVEDLRAFVYRYDIDAGTWSARPVMNIPLNYERGNSNLTIPVSANWRPWTDSAAAFYGDAYNGGPFGNLIEHAYPLASDLTIDTGGNLIIGIKSRSGDITGPNALDPANTQMYTPQNAAELLYACGEIDNWVLESNGFCGGREGYGAGNNQGPGGGEFFDDDNSTHTQVMLGASEHVPGYTSIANSAMDPGIGLNTQGIRYHSLRDGSVTHARVLATAGSGFRKADGVGELEALLGIAPIEIGNRVWFDIGANNGVQDAGEDPVAGATVNLYGPDGELLATTVTNENGEYYFNDSNVPGGLLPTTDYTIRMDNPADFGSGGVLENWEPTTTGSGTPSTDSDGVVVDNFAQIEYTTGQAGQNDHTLDFGFVGEPSIDIEKVDAAGNDADTADDAVVRPGGVPTELVFTVTNTGIEPLVDVVVGDVVTDGDATVTGLSCDFPGGTTGTAWAGPFAVAASFECHATLSGAKGGDVHADNSTVNGTGQGSGKKVTDEDPYHARTPKPEIDIEKFDTAGNDADTVDESVARPADTPTPLEFTITNTGDEALVDVVVGDVVTDGEATVDDFSCTFPDGSTGTKWDGPFAVGASFDCTAILSGLDVGENHADISSVDAVGSISKLPVTDDDPYHAHTPKESGVLNKVVKRQPPQPPQRSLARTGMSLAGLVGAGLVALFAGMTLSRRTRRAEA